MDVRVIGDENTVTGFRLSGVSKGYIVRNHAEAESAFGECEHSGVVIITEKAAELIRTLISEERDFPLVVEIPDRDGPIEKEDHIRVLMRQAIGVDIKKEGEK